MPQDRAQELLSNAQWRRRKGRWRWWVWFSLGILGFVPLSKMAYKTRERKYLIPAVVEAIAFVLYIGTSSGRQPGATLWTDNVLIPILLGSWVFTFTLHKPWLRWLAEQESTAPAAKNWWESGTQPKAVTSSTPAESTPLNALADDLLAPASPAMPPATAPAVVYPPPTEARRLPPPPPPPPASRADVPVADSPQSVCEVNHATAEEIARSLGLEASRATAIVTLRNSRGLFSDFDDFARAAELQPHEWAKFRPLVRVAGTGNSPGSGGRVLDI